MNLKELKSNSLEKRTKGWIKTFTCLFFIVVFFVYWLIFCDPNICKINWFRSPYFDKNGVFHESLFNLNVIWIIFGLFGFCIIYFIFLKFIFRISDYDIIPFIVMPCMIGLMLMVSGFIPFNQKNKNWILFARFIVVFISTIIVFFISIRISNLILLKSSNAGYIYENIKKDYEEMDKIERETKAFTGRKDKKEEYIEI